ncbi:hypothetical protein AVEN_267292-1 [Araneus ventricosus]|uniref:Single domain-containing protein n=1 Tax=Araneus ventricosus TaxID=182803 RepID=A0A4Y2DJC2_ARAVE|nr:hypothetical protein AVEN_267292-1 [Araneus ventricosus]
MQPCAASIWVVVSFLLFCTVPGDGYLYKTVTDTSKGYCEDEKYGQITVGDKGYNYEACEVVFCLRGVYYRQGCDEKPMKGVPECRRVSRPGVYPRCCHKRVECDEEEDADAGTPHS